MGVEGFDFGDGVGVADGVGLGRVLAFKKDEVDEVRAVAFDGVAEDGDPAPLVFKVGVGEGAEREVSADEVVIFEAKGLEEGLAKEEPVVLVLPVVVVEVDMPKCGIFFIAVEGIAGGGSEGKGEGGVEGHAAGLGDVDKLEFERGHV